QQGRPCPRHPSLGEAIDTLSLGEQMEERAEPNNLIPMMKQGEENAVVYLEEFIKALESSRKKPLEVIQKLQTIYADRETCTGWLKHTWEPMENYDFFQNLEELLKFLNTYGFSEETT
uniref:Uncharacterized protein n=1 Tax=Pavo cristatus TaxID=9049 RepID=A0A8C9FF61_PAVCR